MVNYLNRDRPAANSAMANIERKSPSTTSSRILLDTPCKVCQDHSSGKHYGIHACDGCAGFFKRSIRRDRKYACKARGPLMDKCPIDKSRRNQCRACRLNKCLESGMNKDAVQHERGPRNATIRRQVAIYLKDNCSTGSVSPPSPFVSPHRGPMMNLISDHRVVPTTTSLALISPPAPQMLFAMRQPCPATFYHPMSPIMYPYPQMPLCPMPYKMVQNTSSKLFLKIMEWVKAIPTIQSLPSEQQLLLIQHSWRDLFVLTAAENRLILDPTILLSGAGYTAENPPDNLKELRNELTSFRDIILHTCQMNIDAIEYNYLKKMAVFSTVIPNSSEGMSDIHLLPRMQDSTQVAFFNYVQNTHPVAYSRFGSLLVLLSQIKTISYNTIEEIFFRETFAGLTMIKMITDIFHDQPI